MPKDYSTEVLKEVFSAYCTRPSNVGTRDTLDHASFRGMAQDAPNLLDPWLGMVDVDLAFAQARGNTRRRLDFHRFLEALMILSWRKYPDEDNAVAFSRLLAESLFLLPCAPAHAKKRAVSFAEHRLRESSTSLKIKKMDVQTYPKAVPLSLETGEGILKDRKYQHQRRIQSSQSELAREIDESITKSRWDEHNTGAGDYLSNKASTSLQLNDSDPNISGTTLEMEYVSPLTDFSFRLHDPTIADMSFANHLYGRAAILLRTLSFVERSMLLRLLNQRFHRWRQAVLRLKANSFWLAHLFHLLDIHLKIQLSKGFRRWTAETQSQKQMSLIQGEKIKHNNAGLLQLSFFSWKHLIMIKKMQLRVIHQLFYQKKCKVYRFHFYKWCTTSQRKRHQQLSEEIMNQAKIQMHTSAMKIFLRLLHQQYTRCQLRALNKWNQYSRTRRFQCFAIKYLNEKKAKLAQIYAFHWWATLAGTFSNLSRGFYKIEAIILRSRNWKIKTSWKTWQVHVYMLNVQQSNLMKKSKELTFKIGLDKIAGVINKNLHSSVAIAWSRLVDECTIKLRKREHSIHFLHELFSRSWLLLLRQSFRRLFVNVKYRERCQKTLASILRNTARRNLFQQLNCWLMWRGYIIFSKSYEKQAQLRKESEYMVHSIQQDILMNEQKTKRQKMIAVIRIMERKNYRSMMSSLVTWKVYVVQTIERETLSKLKIEKDAARNQKAQRMVMVLTFHLKRATILSWRKWYYYVQEQKQILIEKKRILNQFSRVLGKYSRRLENTALKKWKDLWVYDRFRKDQTAIVEEIKSTLKKEMMIREAFAIFQRLHLASSKGQQRNAFIRWKQELWLSSFDQKRLFDEKLHLGKQERKSDFDQRSNKLVRIFQRYHRMNCQSNRQRAFYVWKVKVISESSNQYLKVAILRRVLKVMQYHQYRSMLSGWKKWCLVISYRLKVSQGLHVLQMALLKQKLRVWKDYSFNLRAIYLNSQAKKERYNTIILVFYKYLNRWVRKILRSAMIQWKKQGHLLRSFEQNCLLMFTRLERFLRKRRRAYFLKWWQEMAHQKTLEGNQYRQLLFLDTLLRHKYKQSIEVSWNQWKLYLAYSRHREKQTTFACKKLQKLMKVFERQTTQGIWQAWKMYARERYEERRSDLFRASRQRKVCRRLLFRIARSVSSKKITRAFYHWKISLLGDRFREMEIQKNRTTKFKKTLTLFTQSKKLKMILPAWKRWVSEVQLQKGRLEQRRMLMKKICWQRRKNTLRSVWKNWVFDIRLNHKKNNIRRRLPHLIISIRKKTMQERQHSALFRWRTYVIEANRISMKKKLQEALARTLIEKLILFITGGEKKNLSQKFYRWKYFSTHVKSTQELGAVVLRRALQRLSKNRMRTIFDVFKQCRLSHKSMLEHRRHALKAIVSIWNRKIILKVARSFVILQQNVQENQNRSKLILGRACGLLVQVAMDRLSAAFYIWKRRNVIEMSKVNRVKLVDRIIRRSIKAMLGTSFQLWRRHSFYQKHSNMIHTLMQKSITFGHWKSLVEMRKWKSNIRAYQTELIRRVSLTHKQDKEYKSHTVFLQRKFLRWQKYHFHVSKQKHLLKRLLNRMTTGGKATFFQQWKKCSLALHRLEVCVRSGAAKIRRERLFCGFRGLLGHSLQWLKKHRNQNVLELDPSRWHPWRLQYMLVLTFHKWSTKTLKDEKRELLFAYRNHCLEVRQEYFNLKATIGSITKQYQQEVKGMQMRWLFSLFQFWKQKQAIKSLATRFLNWKEMTVHAKLQEDKVALEHRLVSQWTCIQKQKSYKMVDFRSIVRKKQILSDHVRKWRSYVSRIHLWRDRKHVTLEYNRVKLLKIVHHFRHEMKQKISRAFTYWLNFSRLEKMKQNIKTIKSTCVAYNGLHGLFQLFRRKDLQMKYRAYNTWNNNTKSKDWRLQLVQKSLSAMTWMMEERLRKRIQKSFNTWEKQVAHTRDLSKKCKQGVQSMALLFKQKDNVKLWVRFRHWKEKACHRRLQSLSLKRCLRLCAFNLQKQQLVSWNQWKTYDHLMRKKKSEVRRVLTRMAHTYACASFKHWARWSLQKEQEGNTFQKTLHHFVAIVHNWIRLRIQNTFSHWRYKMLQISSHTQVSQMALMQEKYRHQLFFKSMAGIVHSKYLRSILRSYHGWRWWTQIEIQRHQIIRLALSNCDNIVKQMLHATLHKTIRQWKTIVEQTCQRERAEEKACLRSSMSAQLDSQQIQARLYAVLKIIQRERKILLVSTFHQWKSSSMFARLEIHQRHDKIIYTLKRFLQVLHHQNVYRSFRIWLYMTGREKQKKDAIRQLLNKWKALNDKKTHRSFCMWRSIMSLETHQKVLKQTFSVNTMMRMIQKWQYKTIIARWNTWKSVLISYRKDQSLKMWKLMRILKFHGSRLRQTYFLQWKHHAETCSKYDLLDQSQKQCELYKKQVHQMHQSERLLRESFQSTQEKLREMEKDALETKRELSSLKSGHDEVQTTFQDMKQYYMLLLQEKDVALSTLLENHSQDKEVLIRHLDGFEKRVKLLKQADAIKYLSIMCESMPQARWAILSKFRTWRDNTRLLAALEKKTLVMQNVMNEKLDLFMKNESYRLQKEIRLGLEDESPFSRLKIVKKQRQRQAKNSHKLSHQLHRVDDLERPADEISLDYQNELQGRDNAYTDKIMKRYEKGLIKRCFVEWKNLAMKVMNESIYALKANQVMDADDGIYDFEGISTTKKSSIGRLRADSLQMYSERFVEAFSPKQHSGWHSFDVASPKSNTKLSDHRDAVEYAIDKVESSNGNDREFNYLDSFNLNTAQDGNKELCLKGNKSAPFLIEASIESTPTADHGVECQSELNESYLSFSMEDDTHWDRLVKEHPPEQLKYESGRMRAEIEIEKRSFSRSIVNIDQYDDNIIEIMDNGYTEKKCAEVFRSTTKESTQLEFKDWSYHAMSDLDLSLPPEQEIVDSAIDIKEEVNENIDSVIDIFDEENEVSSPQVANIHELTVILENTRNDISNKELLLDEEANIMTLKERLGVSYRDDLESVIDIPSEIQIESDKQSGQQEVEVSIEVKKNPDDKAFIANVKSAAESSLPWNNNLSAAKNDESKEWIDRVASTTFVQEYTIPITTTVAVEGTSEKTMEKMIRVPSTLKKGVDVKKKRSKMKKPTKAAHIPTDRCLSKGASSVLQQQKVPNEITSNLNKVGCAPERQTISMDINTQNLTRSIDIFRRALCHWTSCIVMRRNHLSDTFALWKAEYHTKFLLCHHAAQTIIRLLHRRSRRLKSLALYQWHRKVSKKEVELFDSKAMREKTQLGTNLLKKIMIRRCKRLCQAHFIRWWKLTYQKRHLQELRNHAMACSWHSMRNTIHKLSHDRMTHTVLGDGKEDSASSWSDISTRRAFFEQEVTELQHRLVMSRIMHHLQRTRLVRTCQAFDRLKRNARKYKMKSPSPFTTRAYRTCVIFQMFWEYGMKQKVCNMLAHLIEMEKQHFP